MAICLPLCFLTSCSNDDDDNSSISIKKQDLIGTWTIKSVNGKIGEGNRIKVGDKAIFREDGSCTTSWHWMEDSYEIKNGKVFTYCKSNNEPMWIYTLISINENTAIVKMEGTLDDETLCTLVIQ